MSPRVNLALVLVLLGLVGLKGPMVVGQEIIQVEMSDSMIGVVKWRTPKVLVGVDLSKYPDALSTNVEQAKALMLDFTSAYVLAYEKAYLEDRKLPMQFSPFKAYLTARLSEIAAMDSLREVNITPEEFRGEAEPGALKTKLNYIVMAFESSGEFLATQSWVQNMEFVRKSLDELDKYSKEVRAGLTLVTERDIEELNSETDELSRLLTAETEDLALSKWIVFGSLALSVMASGFAILRVLG